MLQTAIATMHEDGQELNRPQLIVPLAEGLAQTGQHELAYRTTCEAVTRAGTQDILGRIALLRVKGEILASMSRQKASEGETCLQEALDLARQRGLLSLELRCGISLARLWAGRGEISRARELLEPIFSRFSEGFQTRDLVAATKLLEELRSCS